MKELIELRTQCNKTFDLGNNQKQIVAKTSAIHYKNTRGEWDDLDPTIVGLRVEKAPYNIELFTDKIGYKGIDPSGKNIELELMDIPHKTPIIEKNKAIYKDIETDVDFEFEFMPNRIKAKRILKSTNANKKAVYRSKREKDAMGRLSNLGVDSEGRKTKISVTENSSGLDEKIITQVFKDQVMKMNKTTRKREWSSEVKYPVTIDPTSTFTLAANNNDGVAVTTGIDTNNNVLRILGVAIMPYIRFPGITIAQSSTINSATLKIYAAGESGSVIFNIKGDGHSNPAVPTAVAQVKSPTTVAGTITGISITNILTSSTWNTNKAGYLLKNINVASIVQTLVNNFAYSNEAMMFFHYHASGVTGRIYARDWGVTKDAELVINFTEGGATYRRRILVGG